MTDILETTDNTDNIDTAENTTAAQHRTIEKTVGGRNVTLTPEQAEAFGRELDALKESVIADLGERDSTYIRRMIKAQRSLEVGGRALLFGGDLPAVLAGRHRDARPEQDHRQHGDRPQRHARPVRLDGRPGDLQPQLRMGQRVPGRPVAPLAQLHAPHLHQHRRPGPRHRLRHPADQLRPAVAAVLPGQPGVRVPADGPVPVRRGAARAGEREDRLR